MTDSVVVEISETEILYKGVRFVADPNTPNKISIYLIKDNHSTIQVCGQVAEEIITNARAHVEEHSDANCGVIFLMHNRKEIKRLYFHVNPDGYKLNSTDRPLEELLQLEEVKALLSVNPKK